MIYGIGCDIVQTSRLAHWVSKPDMLKRFFSEEELFKSESAAVSDKRLQEHYAVRFAAKEAFSKALGTGIRGFSLAELSVCKDSLGKPEIKVHGEAARVLEERCGKDARIHLSLSHEKEYAIAYVIIETGR